MVTIIDVGYHKKAPAVLVGVCTFIYWKKVS